MLVPLARVRPIAIAALLAATVAACGGAPEPSARDAADANDTGRAKPSASPEERQLLKQVSALRSGVKTTVSTGTSVVAEPAYTSAAGGRVCRMLLIEKAKAPRRQRLACKEGQGWFFVPDVLGLESAAP